MKLGSIGTVSWIVVTLALGGCGGNEQEVAATRGSSSYLNGPVEATNPRASLDEQTEAEAAVAQNDEIQSQQADAPPEIIQQPTEPVFDDQSGSSDDGGAFVEPVVADDNDGVLAEDVPGEPMGDDDSTKVEEDPDGLANDTLSPQDQVCADLGYDAFNPTGGGCLANQASDNLFGMTAESMTHYGDVVPLCCYAGQVLLIVNTAARCGFTPQYEELQELQERFEGRGFTVLGFLSNDFGNQGGSRDEVTRCTDDFSLTFEQFIHVGVTPSSRDGQHPLFQWLTSQPGLEGPVNWNFNKFLVSRDGRLLARWNQIASPGDPNFIAAVEAALDGEGVLNDR